MEYCKDWSQLKVTVKLEHLDTLVAIMSMLNNNLMIEDFSDIDLKTCVEKRTSLGGTATKSVLEQIAFVKERM